MAKSYKKYTIQAKLCVKGEAFFESLLSEYALPHKIYAPKDLGIDFICEWILEDRPTGIIFAVQIKTFSEELYRITKVGNFELNRLDNYNIDNPNLIIGQRTLKYWKGLGLPVYLFAIAIGKHRNTNSGLNVYYKRFTPVVTKNGNQKREFFFKVNNGDEFLAFSDKEEKKWGFARDLYIDYMRWTYFKGYLSYLNPRNMGLNQYPQKNDVFDDLFQEYKDIIKSNYKFTKKYLKRIKEET